MAVVQPRGHVTAPFAMRLRPADAGAAFFLWIGTGERLLRERRGRAVQYLAARRRSAPVATYDGLVDGFRRHFPAFHPVDMMRFARHCASIGE